MLQSEGFEYGSLSDAARIQAIIHSYIRRRHQAVTKLPLLQDIGICQMTQLVVLGLTIEIYEPVDYGRRTVRLHSCTEGKSFHCTIMIDEFADHPQHFHAVLMSAVQDIFSMIVRHKLDVPRGTKPADDWDSGKLGRDEDHVRRSTIEREQAVDQALGRDENRPR